MKKYQVCLHYDAQISVEVLAADEGEALAKAREMAESADAQEFNICGERNADVNCF